MKNKLTDLNNHLFAQLERLGDENLKGSDLEAEINRSKALTGVAGQLVQVGRLALEGQKFKTEYGVGRPGSVLPDMLESQNES